MSERNFSTFRSLVFTLFCTFAACMDKGHKETISIRFFSTAFMVLAIAIFKPFGLEMWQWQAYVHLLALFALGMSSCFLSEAILKFIVRMPRSYDQGVSYIISRNLRFQLINTPLVSLFICLYRHIAMSHQVESNKLSLSNFLETLAIIAFLSFAIGLYWRFKFRSRYLAAELEETRQLNEQLKKTQNALVKDDAPQEASDTQVVLSGTTNESVSLDITNLLYIEAVGNYVKVCQLLDGNVKTDMLRATSKQMEENLQAYPLIVRCHRAFLVNLGQVEQIVSNSRTMQLVMKHSHDAIPVSRSNMSQIKEAIRGI